MKVVLSGIISPEQGAFINGRSISDNVLFASKIHHTMLSAPASAAAVMVELDMERTFDRVGWVSSNRVEESGLVEMKMVDRDTSRTFSGTPRIFQPSLN